MSKPFIYQGQTLWFTLVSKVNNAVSPEGTGRALCNVCHQVKEVAGRYASEKTPDIVVCSECAKGTQ